MTGTTSGLGGRSSQRAGAARAAFVAAAVLGLISVASTSTAESLSTSDWSRLHAGEIVIRRQIVESAGRRYVGGVSYAVVAADPAVVAAALLDVSAYPEMLPRIRAVRRVGLSRAGDSVVEIEQGTSWAHGRYTIRVHEENPGSLGVHTIRFWVDSRFSNDLRDIEGFFHVEPAGDSASLLTYEVLVDLGGSWIGHLFEGKVQQVALTTPLLVRRYVEGLDGESL